MEGAIVVRKRPYLFLISLLVIWLAGLFAGDGLA
jgi:hypothetical protein